MKSISSFLLLFCLGISLRAQTNLPVKLALIAGSDEARLAVDLMTTKLSGNDHLSLLERDEIEKAWHEQGQSAGNRNDLKLGQILGADGLLTFELVGTGQVTNLMVQLIAVKPGVILTEGSFSWPLAEAGPWADSISDYLNAFLPKLSLSMPDAVRLSVVNVRSAVASPEGQEMERQLKLLTIQRLSQERRFFVLERQKMQRLAEEKTLNADESAFWNGSYLLEGVADQNGYSAEVITIDARLTPPKGGAPMVFEVSGSRTNLAEVVNQLALRVTGLLKVNSTVKEWNSAGEAAQFYQEAAWALRWRIFAEAQAAADSAWALGKKDLDCALLQNRAYLSELSAAMGGYRNAETSRFFGLNTNGVPVKPNFVDQTRFSQMQELMGAMAHVTGKTGGRKDYYSYPEKPAEPANIDRAIQVLRLYDSFSRTSPEGEPKIFPRGKGPDVPVNSDWYQLGLDEVTAASRILQGFNFAWQVHKPVPEKLAELRALTRSVAARIASAPSVHDGYFVDGRVAPAADLARVLQGNDNIFLCEIDWGCFWQERPEDAIALYRELLASPVFDYFNNEFWQVKPLSQRLVAWNWPDRARLPMVWNDFVRELGGSTNTLWQMEAKASLISDSRSDEPIKAAQAGMLDILRAHWELWTNDDGFLSRGWGLDGGDLMALNEEHQQNVLRQNAAILQENAAKQALEAFAKQKQFLTSFTPYDFNSFNEMFNLRDFTRDQAAELRPLLAAYESNWLAQATSPMNKMKAQGELVWMDTYLGGRIKAALDPLPQTSRPTLQPSPNPVPAPVFASASEVNRRMPGSSPSDLPENGSHVVTVGKFLAMPLEGLSGDNISAVTIVAHHWVDGRLLLDFQYDASTYAMVSKTNRQTIRHSALPGIAVLDPATENWEVIGCPSAGSAAPNHFYHHTTLLNGELISSDGGQIRKYDFKQRAWQKLPVSGDENFELFSVNDRLYAANESVILEILDGGKSTHLLASARRQPPVSLLDTEELGAPTLFAGPNQSLRVSTKDKLLTWTGSDWHEDAALAESASPPMVLREGVLFRYPGDDSPLPTCLSFLLTESVLPEVVLHYKTTPKRFPSANLAAGSTSAGSIEPFWKLPPRMYLENLPAELVQSNLFLLGGHSEIQDVADTNHVIVSEKVVGIGNYNAFLLCYLRDSSAPQKVFLNFDAPGGCPPLGGVNCERHSLSSPLPLAFLVHAGDNLLTASENPIGMLSANFKKFPAGYQAGVWLLPLARVAPILAAQENAQVTATRQTAVAKDQGWKDLLARADRNHNGVIDPDEREEALDDANFIRSELDKIDANHNGWLDTPELACFDANQNGILDPKEQAGINIAVRLLAERQINQFDTGNGFLDQPGYDAMIDSSLHLNANSTYDLQFFHVDENHDNHVDIDELAHLQKRRAEPRIQPGGMPRPPYYNPMNRPTRPPGDPEQRFKWAVENYWQIAGESAK